MAQDQSTGRIVAGIMTAVGLGLLWVVVAANLPSEQDFSPREAVFIERTLPTVDATSGREATLDLSIPGVRPPPSTESMVQEEQERDSTLAAHASQPRGTDLRTAQVASLRCEAEIEQVCLDVMEGASRMKCLEQREQQVTAPCRPRLRARFLKWKHDRNRMLTACQVDVKRWCGSMRVGDGRLIQCLEEHAQDVSDSCHATLPKGTVSFRH